MGEGKIDEALRAQVQAALVRLASLWDDVAPAGCGLLLLARFEGGALLTMTDQETGVAQRMALAAAAAMGSGEPLQLDPAPGVSL